MNLYLYMHTNTHLSYKNTHVAYDNILIHLRESRDLQGTQENHRCNRDVRDQSDRSKRR